MINFFLYCIKKMSFSSSPKGTPHDRCRIRIPFWCKEGVRLYSLLFLPLLVCFSEMFVLVAISYQLQEYIESGWTWCICQYNDCLKFGNSWGDPFVNFKLHFLNVKCSQKLVNLENQFWVPDFLLPTQVRYSYCYFGNYQSQDMEFLLLTYAHWKLRNSELTRLDPLGKFFQYLENHSN